MKKIKILISGMHCASCASNIERALKKISGVKEVSANAITNKAFVDVENGVSKEEMKKAIERVGYKVLGYEED